LIQHRIHHLQSQIPSHVQIMGVSKGYSIEHIQAAYEAGLRHFGESRIQEAQPKITQLRATHPDITWHLIGHLQTNKAKAALDLFDWIDSVDSLKLAQALDKRAANLAHPPALSLQIKLALDPDKYGWSKSQLWADLSELLNLEHLSIRGLMTILPLGLKDPELEALFRDLPNIAEQIEQRSGGMICPTVLSMGMSSDYPLAISAGSTQIRIGRSLFADTLVTS
jgi:pyridoxal phosphate enzyme (YggS family)